MWSKTLLRILKELNHPPCYLVPPEQFEALEGDKIDGSYGISGIYFPIYTTQKGLRGKVLANVIYHEIGHSLFPHRKHWWIECYAQKMARGGGTGDYSKLHGHSIQELPDRSKLLTTSLRAVERLKKKNVKKKPKAKPKANKVVSR